MKFDFIEIGTSDFRTLIEKADDRTIGLSIEPIKQYLDNLPNKPLVTKANYAISDIKGEVDIYYVDPGNIVKYNLPTWVRGCNSINHPHPTVKKMLGEKYETIITIDKVKVITWEDIIRIYDVEEIKTLQIDTEGHDDVILENYYKECILYPNILADNIIFEYNELSNKPKLENIIHKFKNLGYTGKRIDMGNYKLYKFQQSH